MHFQQQYFQFILRLLANNTIVNQEASVDCPSLLPELISPLCSDSTYHPQYTHPHAHTRRLSSLTTCIILSVYTSVFTARTWVLGGPGLCFIYLWIPTNTLLGRGQVESKWLLNDYTWEGGVPSTPLLLHPESHQVCLERRSALLSEFCCWESLHPTQCVSTKQSFTKKSQGGFAQWAFPRRGMQYINNKLGLYANTQHLSELSGFFSISQLYLLLINLGIAWKAVLNY